MSVFDQMAAAITADPNMAVAGMYLPKTGNSVSVRILRRDLRQEVAFPDLAASVPAVGIQISCTQLAGVILAECDRITIGSETFVVRSFEKDDTSLFYTFNVDPLKP